MVLSDDPIKKRCVRAGCYHEASNHKLVGSLDAYACTFPGCICNNYLATRETTPAQRDEAETQIVTPQAMLNAQQTITRLTHQRDEARAIITMLMTGAKQREKETVDWALGNFGEQEVMSKAHRSMRFLEEAFELVQPYLKQSPIVLEGIEAGKDNQIVKVMNYVLSRPVGDPKQEIGGVMTTLAVLAHAHGTTAEDEATREFLRILSQPKEHWQARNKTKNDAGLNAVEPKVDPAIDKETVAPERVVFVDNPEYYTMWGETRVDINYPQGHPRRLYKLRKTEKQVADELDDQYGSGIGV